MKKRAAFLIIILSLYFVLSACSPAAGKDKSEAAANEGAAENARAVEPGDILSREEAEALTGLKPDAIDKNDEESVGLKLIAYHFGDKLLQLSLNHMDSAFIQILYDGAKEIHDRHKGLQNIGDEAYAYSSGMPGEWDTIRKSDYILRSEHR